MKKILIGILIGVVVTVLILAGILAWYFFKLSGNLSNLISSGSVTSDLQSGTITTPFGTVTPTQVNQAYSGLTQVQKDCLVNAVGQAKVDGFLRNDPAIIQTITTLDYARAAACQK